PFRKEFVDFMNLLFFEKSQEREIENVWNSQLRPYLDEKFGISVEKLLGKFFKSKSEFSTLENFVLGTSPSGISGKISLLNSIQTMTGFKLEQRFMNEVSQNCQGDISKLYIQNQFYSV